MDYEVFFGDKSGSVYKCMIEPTGELLKIAEINGFQFTFFWDVGHLIAMERNVKDFPELAIDIEQVIQQVQSMITLGHAVELHIHPHWEKAKYNATGWEMNLKKHYKMSDFSNEERIEIFEKYKKRLEQVTNVSSQVFRAGGWCIQPFLDFKSLFEKHNIRIDSSVLPGVKWISEQYNIDFTTVKTQEPYTFSDDVCRNDETDIFKEYPISSRKYSPMFFWRLYILGRLFPEQHKMWGDGNFIAQPGGKKEMLTKGKLHHLSTDGYFASELQCTYSDLVKDRRKNMVIIGHPKSLTKFALKKIKKFTIPNDKNKRFLTLKRLFMRLVSRDQIDEIKWKAWCEKQPESQPFLSLDYLDSVSKKLQFLLNDDETGGMPLPYFERLGVKTLYTPVFCRWVDWLGENPIEKSEINECLKKNFNLADIYFRKEMLSEKSEDLIYQNLNSSNFKLNQQGKRKLKAFEKTEAIISSEINIEVGVEFLRLELSNRIETLHSDDFDSLRMILVNCHKNNKLIQYSVLVDGLLVGLVFLINTDNTVLYLKGTCTEDWKNHGGMYALIHKGIQSAFESNRTFDFGGSRIEGVRKFNRCFGGVDQHYFGYSWNDGPAWYKTLKELKNKWKKR